MLLVTIDTLRADAVDFEPGPARLSPGGVTPNLDRLAAGGRVFSHAYAHAPLTLPSHASLLTGLYPPEHGLRDNGGFRLRAGVPTLAGRLAAEGFATAAFVAAFPLDARFGLNRGFDVYDDRCRGGGETEVFAVEDRPGTEVVAGALAWWRAHAGERRFLWVHLYEPHSPYAPPEPFASRFAGQPYLGEVAAADAYLEPLLSPLVDGAVGRTLVVVTADHGEALGDHGETTHGLFAYDSTLRVPLLLWGAGVPPGRDDRLARHVDVVPTVLAAAGAAPLPDLPGRSLLAPPQGAVTSYFEAVHGALNLGFAPLRGTVEEAGWLKYIELPLPELYALARDPAEVHNLVDERRRDAARLDRTLPDEVPWPPDKGAVASTEADALAGLGYVTGPAPAKRHYTAADDPKNLVEIDRRMQLMHRLYAVGRLDEAAAQARAVLTQRGDMEAAWSFLAQVLLSQGRNGQALALMEDAARRGVASDALRRQRALALAWTGRADEAVALLEPVAGAGDPATLTTLGTALVEAGRAAEAVPVLERVFARDPEDAATWESLSMAYLALDRFAEAESAARRSLALDDGRPHAWNNLGVALYRQADGAGALAAWERAVAVDDQQYDTLFNLGLKGAELGRPDVARRALARFLREAPPERYAADMAYARALYAELGGPS